MVKIILVYQNSGGILNKLKSKGVSASCLSRYGFSTLYTTSSHNLFKEKLTELIKQAFNREGSLYLACNEIHFFFYASKGIVIALSILLRARCISPIFFEVGIPHLVW